MNSNPPDYFEFKKWIQQSNKVTPVTPLTPITPVTPRVLLDNFMVGDNIVTPNQMDNKPDGKEMESTKRNLICPASTNTEDSEDSQPERILIDIYIPPISDPSKKLSFDNGVVMGVSKISATNGMDKNGQGNDDSSYHPSSNNGMKSSSEDRLERSSEEQVVLVGQPKPEENDDFSNESEDFSFQLNEDKVHGSSDKLLDSRIRTQKSDWYKKPIFHFQKNILYSQDVNPKTSCKFL